MEAAPIAAPSAAFKNKSKKKERYVWSGKAFEAGCSTPRYIVHVWRSMVREILFTGMAAALVYFLYMLCGRMATIFEFVVEKATWVASFTMVAYGLEWAWLALGWTAPLWSLAVGPAVLPSVAATHGTVLAAPHVCKFVAGAITVLLSVFSCCKPK